MLFEEFETQTRRVGEECLKYAAEAEKVFSQTRGGDLDSTSIERAGAATGDQLKEKYAAIHEWLTDICDAYLSMNQKEREEARELVGSFPSLLKQLSNHLGWESRRVFKKTDQQLLLRGLAAISLADLRTDSRDLLMAMGNVYLHAHEVGAFLSVPLVRIAEISNPSPRPPNKTSMKDFFLKFEESAHFKSAVAVKLNRND